MLETKRLKNGTIVALEAIPFVRSISFGIWVGTGSRHEPKHLNGVSHFIEHMLFKGTETRSARDIADEMDAIGGQINAYTTKEYTCYHTRTLDVHFDVALDIMSDMFFYSNFDSDNIIRERNVILEEINMYEDSPEELCHDLLQENIWGGDPLGFPILGVKETISSFDKDIFVQYMESNYRPGNTVISVAGNFDPDEMMEKLEKKFGKWQSKDPDRQDTSQANYCKTLAFKQKDIEQVHICMGFPGVALDSPESYTMTVFNTIFGGGMSSRLFQKIREEKGLTYAIYSYASNYKNAGSFTIYAGMSASQTEEVMRLIIDEIHQLDRDKISEETLTRTKEQLKSNYIIGLESTSNRMSAMGRSQICLNRIQTPEEIMKKVDDVSLYDIKQLYRTVLNMENISLSAVGKTGGLDFERILKNG